MPPGPCFPREATKPRPGSTSRRSLFDDDAEGVLEELDRRRAVVAKTGPGTKSKRDRLEASRNYIAKRVAHIRYGSLRRRDLVIGSGVVEGAIKFVLAKRCDHGGMRWIKERVQAVAQLRCIVVNGDWEAFERFVHERQCVAAVINAARLGKLSLHRAFEQQREHAQ